jgi:hypothetical protein
MKIIVGIIRAKFLYYNTVRDVNIATRAIAGHACAKCTLCDWAEADPRLQQQNCLSEVGFEPTPGEPDCDLNAAP